MPCKEFDDLPRVSEHIESSNQPGEDVRPCFFVKTEKNNESGSYQLSDNLISIFLVFFLVFLMMLCKIY